MYTCMGCATSSNCSLILWALYNWKCAVLTRYIAHTYEEIGLKTDRSKLPMQWVHIDSAVAPKPDIARFGPLGPSPHCASTMCLCFFTSASHWLIWTRKSYATPRIQSWFLALSHPSILWSGSQVVGQFMDLTSPETTWITNLLSWSSVENDARCTAEDERVVRTSQSPIEEEITEEWARIIGARRAEINAMWVHLNACLDSAILIYVGLVQPNFYYKKDWRVVMVCTAHLWSYWETSAISLPLHGRL